MVPQIAPDPAHGDEPDLPNTPAYVNPPDGYGVQLDASHSVGIQPTSTFSWTVTDSRGHATPLSGEDPTIDLPQGPYTVQLTATGLIGTDGPQFATTDDPGQGRPHRLDRRLVCLGRREPGRPRASRPAVGLFARPGDEHSRTRTPTARPSPARPSSRSSSRRPNPHEAVTFVSVADSGASIPVGVLGPMPSIGDPSVSAPGPDRRAPADHRHAAHRRADRLGRRRRHRVLRPWPRT